MLTPEQRVQFEDQIRIRLDAEQVNEAATAVIETYGSEIFGYLVATTRSETDADEVFAMFSEDLWRGLADFRWEASLRTWAYTLARNAFYRLCRTPHYRAKHIPVSQTPEIHNVVDRVRTKTKQYLQTERKTWIATLRKQLPEQDQSLLVLRLGRGMSWNEIAQIMSEEAGTPPDKVRCLAATLRKRFERAKTSLKKMVQQQGIPKDAQI